jgi:hypothetical protein
MLCTSCKSKHWGLTDADVDSGSTGSDGRSGREMESGDVEGSRPLLADQLARMARGDRETRGVCCCGNSGCATLRGIGRTWEGLVERDRGGWRGTRGKCTPAYELEVNRRVSEAILKVRFSTSC